MRTILLIAVYIFVLALFFPVGSVEAQSTMISETASPASARLNRSRGLNMLKDIKSVLKERYYDKNFRGIDIDARFKAAEERVKQMDTNSQIFRVIAQVLVDFDDSHTRFIPPGRANQVVYGFTIQMIGENCFITAVKKGSDAEKKGLKPGTQIVGVGPFAPTRENLWKMNYLLYQLDPKEVLKLAIIDENNREVEVEIVSSFRSMEDRRKEAEKRRKEKKENPYKCVRLNSQSVACRLETFSVERKYVERMMKEASAYENMILDLRGNGGGYVVTLERLVGHFFDRDVVIGKTVRRDKERERVARSVKDSVFKGKLVVLIDSNSASASEVFARVIQLEKRGVIVGDVSAGAVVTSNFITMANERGVPGYQTISLFGMNVTVSDLIMSDGNRLEKVGVIPDHPVGPTGTALRAQTDPVLAFAAQLLGADLMSDAAGKIGFLKAKDEDEDSEESDDDGQ